MSKFVAKMVKRQDSFLPSVDKRKSVDGDNVNVKDKDIVLSNVRKRDRHERLRFEQYISVYILMNFRRSI